MVTLSGKTDKRNRKGLIPLTDIKKAALYVRVSTQEQAVAGYSVGEQRVRLLAYCKARGYVVHDIYVDGGFSGSNLNRPAIQKLKADIGQFDIVVVYKLDRLSRSQFDILDLIQNTFLPQGVDFVSMSEAFDTSTPFGRAMIGILGVFAQLEREQITERMTMGRRARAKEGKYHGGGIPAIGYDYDREKDRLVPNVYEAEQVRLLFQMTADGASNAEILKALNDAGYTTRYGKWNSSARISRTIRLDTYLGIIRFGDVVYENAHEPLIDRELFEAANAVRTKKMEIYGRNIFNRTTLLAGLIWCAKCGARYGTTISRYKNKSGQISSQNRYHSCYSRAFPTTKMARQPGCTNKIWKIEHLEAAVEAEVQKIILEPDYFQKLKEPALPSPEPMAGSQKRLIDIDRQISRLMELYSLDNIPFDVIAAKIDDLHKEKTALTTSIAQTTIQTVSQPDHDQFRALLADMSNLWHTADIPQKRALLSALIRKIHIHDDQLTFDWAF